MSIDNLDDYILRFKMYQEGDYEYGTLISPAHIKNAIESGKKIVFAKSKTFFKSMVILGSVFLILGLIIGIVLSVIISKYWIITFSIPMVMFGGVGLYFLIPGLQKRGTSFVVLGPEGIAYKLSRGPIQGYRWEVINMDFISIKPTYLIGLREIEEPSSSEIIIAMPNGEIIKISPGDYRSKEIKFNLFMLTFKAYYDYGKEKSFERRTVEEEKPPITQSWIGETSLDREHYIEVLKDAYQNYKQKKYNFGRYGTKDQIRNEFLNGKTFVLKGGLRSGDWGSLILFCAIGLFMFIIITLMSFFRPGDFLFFLGLGFFWLFFWLVVASILLLKIRELIVVGTSGVYYRKILNKGFFLWDEIGYIEGKMIKDFMFRIFTIVNIYKSSGKKIKFRSRPYLLKEIPKHVEHEIFPILFKIYFELGRNPNLFLEEYKKDLEEYKKAFPYICNSCGEFHHTFYEYCRKCRTKGSLRKAYDSDYEIKRTAI